MIAQGHVQGGVVVLADGVRLAEGQQVTVFARSEPHALGASYPTSPPPGRREALLELIGIWKSGHAPDDEEIERMVERHRMKKYG